MASSHRRSTTGWACITGLSIALIVAFASFASIATAAQSSRAIAHSSRAVPASLAHAARRSASADKALVASAKALKHCISKHRSHPSKCRAAKASVQRSGVQLAAARRGLAQVAHRTAHTRSSVDSVQQAPSLNVAGDTLSWTHVAGFPSYVLVRTVAGQPAQYSVVSGTSTTPPPVPGVTASYSVRTAVNGSEWSASQAISYPSATSVPDTQAAPVIAVSGENITWSPVGGVSTYILSSTAPGKATQYTVVSGDSITPEPAPGQTLQFSIRTAVDGSAWSAPVSITFPATAGAGSGEAPVTFSEPFVKGINANIAGWGSQAPQVVSEMNTLGVNWEREDLSWSEAEPQQGVFDWSSFESVLATARANGITILPIVGYAPSWTSPDNAAAYAEFVKAAVARFGPGTEANLQWWELWNEPYFAYAWSNKTPEPEAYARDVVAAAQAARSTAPSVKLLVSADYVVSPQTGGSTPYETSWIDDMFAAEPELGKWINAVSAHPYGDDPALPLAEAGGYKDGEGNWAFQRIDTIRAKFLAHGVNVPFWITEAGWSTYESNEAVQAHNYADLITQVKARPWIRALFPFCLREFSANATNNQPGFGLLKYGSWQPKEAFTTLQAGFKTLS
jgi:hypothetical protein